MNPDGYIEDSLELKKISTGPRCSSFYNPVTRSCVDCITGTYFDVDQRKCVSCENGQ